MKHALIYYIVFTDNGNIDEGNYLCTYKNDEVLTPIMLNATIKELESTYLSKNYVEPQIIIKNIMYLK